MNIMAYCRMISGFLRRHGAPWRVALLFVVAISTVVVTLPQASISATPKSAKQKEQKEKIQINFIDVDIATVANFISKITGKNFIYDDKFTGKITIVAPAKIDADEAFDLFLSVLELKGYSTVFTGTAYKIIPSSGVKHGPLTVAGEGQEIRVNESYAARLVPLGFIQTQDVLPVLQPLISKEGYISAFGKGNTILIIDNTLNIEKILSIVKLLDVEPSVAPFKIEVVYLQNAQAENVAQLLRQIKQKTVKRVSKGAPSQSPSPSPDASADAGLGLGIPVPDKRLNALILYGTPEDNEENKRLISLIDVPSPATSSRINVYYLENAESGEIAKVLESLTKPGAQAGAQPGQDGEKSAKLVITPDKSTNSLIIMASPEDYQNVVSVIQKLDRRPKQVFVEAMITEVSINRSLELGSQWRASGTVDGYPVAIGGLGTVDSTSISSILSGMSGFTIGGLANILTIPVTGSDGTTTDLTVPGFAALFSLSEFKDVVNVLSTPHILTSDNKEAEIMVGENVPFLSKFESTSSTDSTVIQSIERKDVGITLRIKPQISEGNYIKLDIYQEISALSTSTQAADVITTKRSAKTSVVVRDRQTVVIGGLIQDKAENNSTKVPLLGDIPILGWLFKSKTNDKEKVNLLVYITPTIVKDFEKLDEIREKKDIEYKERLKQGEEDDEETDKATEGEGA
jgi:general secretion pathway protein D